MPGQVMGVRECRHRASGWVQWWASPALALILQQLHRVIHRLILLMKTACTADRKAEQYWTLELLKTN